MTLNEFISSTMSELERFRIYYLEQNGKDPDNYPLEITTSGDWDEQFHNFVSIKPDIIYDEDYLKQLREKAKESWDGVDVDKYLRQIRGYEES